MKDGGEEVYSRSVETFFSNIAGWEGRRRVVVSFVFLGDNQSSRLFGWSVPHQLHYFLVIRWVSSDAL